ncbi:LysR family transcriptional regulator [Nisaea acidiphila]|uniref:LysR family transcriptional regulator n=1 Tax=Nisaea acidiphila TaxID=1862145 RepID=A0A9J7AQF6_9PROT|nr:LysR family transcriptional regulator [Nisaea acidiphila]UUX49835.1 LysR family transcriptional regulator [Nisaea acidiphila]
MDQSETTFLRVVEAGSLRAAAEQLGTDPSAISRRLASLESRLGVKLLTRSTRRSVPTEAGLQYYDGMRRLADEQLALEAKVSGQMELPSGLLRVAAPLDFGSLFIAPVLHDLISVFPALDVEMLLGSEFEQIAQQSIDVAVRIGKLPDSSLICRRLGEVPRVLVGATSYFEDRGIPARPADLRNHEFVFYARRQADAPVTFEGPCGREEVDVSGRFTVNSVSAVRSLVENGCGLHVGPLWAFKDGISDGRLKAILTDYQLDAYPIHVLYHSAGFVPAKVRRFIDFLDAAIQRQPGKFAT